MVVVGEEDEVNLDATQKLHVVGTRAETWILQNCAGVQAVVKAVVRRVVQVAPSFAVGGAAVVVAWCVVLRSHSCC